MNILPVESLEVLQERVKRGELTVSSVGIKMEFSTRQWMLLASLANPVERARLLKEEGLPQLFPLPTEWPKATPGDGQPPTIAQIAFPGRHIHPWGPCFIDHGDHYKYYEGDLEGHVVYYSEPKEWDEYNGIKRV